MKKGFTLAEVLITLAVIGVVAVLTVPNMMKSYQKQVSVTQLQKFYNQLRTAATNCMQEEMSDSLIGTTADRDPQAFIKKYLKPTSFFTDNTDGFGEPYQPINGGTFSLSRVADCSDVVCASLETGASLMAYFEDGDSMAEQEEYEKGDDNQSDRHGFITLFVDVNGKKGPNIAGRDLFEMRLYSDGVVAKSYEGRQGEGPGFDNKEGCPNSYGGICFDYIKNNGWVMDY